MPALPFRAAILVTVLSVGTINGQATPITAKPGPRVDRYGDALPPGALFRIGTTRLQLDRQLQAIAASPDGKLVAAVSDDQLGIWEVRTGREVLRLIIQTPENALANLAPTGGWLDFTPDGKLLSFNSKRKLYLLDTATGKFGEPLGNHADRGAFSRDGKVATGVEAVGDIQCNVYRWDLATRKMLSGWSVGPKCRLSADGALLAELEIDAVAKKQRLRLREAGIVAAVKGEWLIADPIVRDFVLSPDGRLIAGVSPDGLIRVWESATGAEKARWKAKAGARAGISALAFTPDSASVLSTNTTGLARWDWKTAKQVQEYVDVGGPIAFRPDGKTMAVQGSLGSVRILDVETGKDLCPLPRAGKFVALSADARLAAWSEGSAIVLAETATGKEWRRWQAHVRFVEPLAFAPAGKTLASAGTDGRIRLWEIERGMEMHTMLKKGVNLLFFSPDGRRLVSSGYGEVCLWDAVSGERKGSWTGKGTVTMAPRVNAVAVPDAKRRILQLHDPSNGKLLHELPGYRQEVFDPLAGIIPGISSQCEFAPMFSQDGKLLLAGVDPSPGPDIIGAAYLHDVSTGKRLRPVLASSAGDFHIQGFSPDGRLLTLVDSNSNITLQRTSSGEVFRALASVEGSVFVHAVFTPDSRILISAAKGVVQFWEVATGGEIARRQAHAGEVRELIVSANGRLLATVSRDHTALVWDVTRLVTEVGAPAPEVTELWQDLAHADAAKGRRAIETLIAAPEQAIALLHKRLQATPIPDAKTLAAWIADLGSDDFERRQQAEQELDRLSEAAGPALQKALAANPPLEARRRIEGLLKRLDTANLSAEALRSVRAVQVLETIGSQEARAILQTLADGTPGARPTQDAKAALERLGKRVAIP